MIAFLIGQDSATCEVSTEIPFLKAINELLYFTRKQCRRSNDLLLYALWWILFVKYKARPAYGNIRHSPLKTPVDVPSTPDSSKMTEQTDWWAKQPSQVACFSEDLECAEELYTLPANTYPRISLHRPPEGERRIERGSARQSSFNGRERAIVNQTNIGTVSNQR